MARPLAATSWDGSGIMPALTGLDRARAVLLICGPPGAGKTTVAADLAAAHDLTVMDIDTAPWRGDERRYRAAIANLRRDPQARAIIIRSGARASSRARWAATTGATSILILTTPADTCRQRVVARARPRPTLPQQLAAIATWWHTHETDAATTTQRTQAPEWGGRRARAYRAILAQSLPRPCSKCGALVHPWQRWDVDHLIDRHRAPGRTWDPSNLAVAHASCNRSDGAAKGNRRRARQTTWTAPGW